MATKFIETVSEDNARRWQQNSYEMSRDLKQLMSQSAVGHVIQSIIHKQITYIKSLPIEATDRVDDIQNRALDAVVNVECSEHFTKMIACYELFN